MTKSGLKSVFYKYSFICGIPRLLYMAYKLVIYLKYICQA
ncbi:hypothetical protein HMPREF1495_0837 [Lachnoanaerobaculum sp. MSX33]|nr:hypothetical protein HMPREF1495_0837 [Lachnoanaerobaculum sp. MSX33]